MTETEFWELIEEARADSDGVDDLVERLRELLEGRPRAAIVAFQKALNAVMARAYTWELIAGACFLGCGKSDDGFEDFRAWLVAQGRATFESVLADVTRLADIPFDESPTDEWYSEELHMLPGELGGEEDDEAWPYRADPPAPLGAEVSLTKADLQARYPKLWRTFGDEFMIGIH